jgi:hypothetical protein
MPALSAPLGFCPSQQIELTKASPSLLDSKVCGWIGVPGGARQSHQLRPAGSRGAKVRFWHKADTDVRFCICPFQDIEYAIEHIGPFAHGGWE